MADRVLLDEAGTFMGVPGSCELSNSKAAMLGAPFDCGVHPTRTGARLGPQAIRQHSGLVWRYEPPFHDYDPVARLGLVDCGNVRVRSSFVAEACDIDVLDPSVAPSVATPTWGGLGAKEGRAILDGLADLDFVAFDVNTASAPHDSAGVTAFLAGTVILKCRQPACVGLDRGHSNQIAQ